MKPKLAARHNYHIHGEQAWWYALMLVGQLPDAYCIITTSDTFAQMAKAAFPTRDVRTGANADRGDRHAVFVLTHFDADQSRILHESVTRPDFLYTVQEGDVLDLMEDVKTIDADIELLTNIHLAGRYINLLLPNMMNVVDGIVPIYNMESDNKLNECVDPKDALVICHEYRPDVIAEYREKYGYVWSYYECLNDAVGGAVYNVLPGGSVR